MKHALVIWIKRKIYKQIPIQKQAASSTYISSTFTSLKNSPTHPVFSNNITHIIYEKIVTLVCLNFRLPLTGITLPVHRYEVEGSLCCIFQYFKGFH